MRFNFGGPMGGHGHGGGFGGFPGMGGFGGFGGGFPGMGGHGQRRRQQQKRTAPSPIPTGSTVYTGNLNAAKFNNLQGTIVSFTGDRFAVDISAYNLGNNFLARYFS